MIWWLVGYMILFIYRPFEIWPILATIRLERIYFIAMLVAALASGRIGFRSHPIHFGVLLMVIAVLFSWVSSPWSGTEAAKVGVLDWLKVVGFYVVATTICKDKRDLDIFVIGLCVAVGLMLFHSVYEGFCGRYSYSMGVRRLLGINTTFRHPNALAGLTVITIPYAAYVWRQCTNKWIRRCGLAFIIVGMIGVLMTSSRMGFAGVLFWGLLKLLQSKRKFTMVSSFLVVFLVAWPMVPEERQKRLLSLIDDSYAADQKGAIESADARAISWQQGVDLFEKYPLTGCGPGAWIPATGGHLVSHHLYGQLIGEVGLVGTGAFLALLLLTLKSAFSVARLPSKSPWRSPGIQMYGKLATAVIESYSLMLFFGFGGGTLFRYFWIWTPALVLLVSQVTSNWDWSNDDVPNYSDQNTLYSDEFPDEGN